MRRAAAGAMLVLLGCGDDRAVVTGPLPEGTRYVAALFYDAEDKAIIGTPLSPYRDGAPIEIAQSGVEGEATRAALYAWTEGVIPAEVLFARDDRPVSLAQPSDPVLPAPSYYGVAVGVGDRFDVAAIVEAPELTAPWMPRCPQLFDASSRIYFDARCVPRRCLAAPPAQVGCGIQQNLAPCGLGPLELSIDGRGVLRPANAYSIANCVEASGPPTARISYACAGCRIDVYVEPEAVPSPPFELAEVEVYPGLPELTRPYKPDFDGYVADLLVRDGRAMVSSYDGSSSQEECKEGPRVSRLHVYDTDTLVITSTATVAGCVHRIAPDPLGPGFFGLDAIGARLYRFDAEARVLEQIPITVSRDHDLSELTAFSEPPRLWMGLRGDDGAPSLITIFDAATKAPIAEVPNRERLRTLIPGADGLVAAGYNGLVDFMAIADGEVVGSVNVGTGTGIGNEAHTLVYVSGVERYLIIDGSDNSGIHVSSMAMTGAATIEYAQDAILTGGIAWPLDPSFALIGFVERAPPHRASVALFDARSSHFLPDTFEVGTGPLIAMTRDDEGRIYGLLPYVGKLIRLTPRS